MPPSKAKKPKTKREPSSESASDDSDSSGPTDRNPPSRKRSTDLSKKGAAETASTSSCAHRVADVDGHATWKLDKMRNISVSEFKGKTYVNIREYYEKDGKLLPGKKGIALTSGQWKTLVESSADITAVLAEKS